MATVVIKFGGASVRDLSQFHQVSSIVIKKLQEYSHVVVVISAMANMTDELLYLAKAVHPNPPARELDMLLSVGERVSMSLLAMTLAKKNFTAVSFTGSQCGIITNEEHTDAKIIAVTPLRVTKSLAEGKIVIVAGFQGVSRAGEITTLGRGGTDTTAVALAIALRADVEFYKDVLGIYSADPKKDSTATLFSQLNYRDALQIVESTETQVLHPRAIRLAEKNQLPLRVTSFQKDSMGTVITTNTCRENAMIFELPN